MKNKQVFIVISGLEEFAESGFMPDITVEAFSTEKKAENYCENLEEESTMFTVEVQ